MAHFDPTTIEATAAGFAVFGGLWARVKWVNKSRRSIVHRWFVKHVDPILAARTEPISLQLKPNSGSSAFDLLSRIDERTLGLSKDVEDIRRHLARQDGALVQHLQGHAQAISSVRYRTAVIDTLKNCGTCKRPVGGTCGITGTQIIPGMTCDFWTPEQPDTPQE